MHLIYPVKDVTAETKSHEFDVLIRLKREITTTEKEEKQKQLKLEKIREVGDNNMFRLCITLVIDCGHGDWFYCKNFYR